MGSVATTSSTEEAAMTRCAAAPVTTAVDSLTDVVIENVDGHNNDVNHHVLPANVEYGYVGLTAESGNELANALLGHNGNDVLFGLAGNETIDGNASDDTMVGELGTLIRGRQPDRYGLFARCEC